MNDAKQLVPWLPIYKLKSKWINRLVKSAREKRTPSTVNIRNVRCYQLVFLLGPFHLRDSSAKICTCRWTLIQKDGSYILEDNQQNQDLSSMINMYCSRQRERNQLKEWWGQIFLYGIALTWMDYQSIIWHWVLRLLAVQNR